MEVQHLLLVQVVTSPVLVGFFCCNARVHNASDLGISTSDAGIHIQGRLVIPDD